MSAVVWFRRDLRLADNPAWSEATNRHESVQALFVIDPRLWKDPTTRRAQMLAAHLAALDLSIAGSGGCLKVVHGTPERVLVEIAADHERVYWNDDYNPFAVARDDAVEAALPRVARYHGSAVHRPGSIVKPDGSHYRVFSAYWNRWRNTPWQLAGQPGSARLLSDRGDGVPAHDYTGLAGEVAADERLSEFLDQVDSYQNLRDFPAKEGTSRLSTDLKFGTISPARVVAEVGDGTPGREVFIRQLCWRDFHAQILHFQPDGRSQPYRKEYARVPWRWDADEFNAWTSGRTGFPFVDAGMRQLASTGWMHNRVRMVVASFLVKDLLIDWRHGERWFRCQLVDADVAQNIGNWQWVAGTGVDAAPYFRIFNPTRQSRRFDPDGDYIQQWVPELRGMPSDLIHEPWGTTPLARRWEAAVLASGYPKPLVDHASARERTIHAFRTAAGSHSVADKR
ncbi:MAG: deoxyribodipyrimidine photo-lyase [Actinomycetota bacterium]|nr:deoxyribodipyrimidine photo-lyase [Actinomycetota bacterium]